MKSLFFKEIREAKFLKFPKLDRARSGLRVAKQAWNLPFSYVALRVVGAKNLDLPAISEAISKLNERLREDRKEMKSPKVMKLFDLNIELNEIGIEMNGAVINERKLLDQCVALKSEAISEQNPDKGRAFVKSAEQLFNAREDTIAIMKKKTQKQLEVAEQLDKFKVITKDDKHDLAKAAIVDLFTTIGTGQPAGYATAVTLGEVTAKYLVRAAEKTAMSTKVLDQGIWIRQRCQERYKAWIEKPAIREIVGSSKTQQFST